MVGTVYSFSCSSSLAGSVVIYSEVLFMNERQTVVIMAVFKE